MENLDTVGFKFKVGEIVYHRLTLSDKYVDASGLRKTPLLILSRMAEECSGGVQLMYLCRLGISQGVATVTFDPSNSFKINECELEIT